MWSSPAKTSKLFAAAAAVAALLAPCGGAVAQGQRVSCGDPRVKDALMLALLERYKTELAGRQIREVGRMSPGHAGFTPEGHSICAMWVNVQTTGGQMLLAGTARFEVYFDASGTVVAALL